LLQLVILFLPWSQQVLKTSSLNLEDWGLALSAGPLPILAMEIVKMARRWSTAAASSAPHTPDHRTRATPRAD
jgi:hypothetical protein